uniref:Uncharacterized protein n=1 Tax=Cacopsylla melanoneura TaxID=428564 RepID=A0A8D8M8C4_9HEMI
MRSVWPRMMQCLRHCCTITRHWTLGWTIPSSGSRRVTPAPSCPSLPDPPGPLSTPRPLLLLPLTRGLVSNRSRNRGDYIRVPARWTRVIRTILMTRGAGAILIIIITVGGRALHSVWTGSSEAPALLDRSHFKSRKRM